MNDSSGNKKTRPIICIKVWIMIRNYLKIAWRNLLKNKQSSSINIGGLAIGMAVAMLIGFWLWDELTYNQYHENYDRVARIMQHQTSNGQVYTGEALPFPLGEELKTNYGDNFKYLAMASWEGEYILSRGNDHQKKNGIYIDKDGPEILSLKMIQGALNGLADPHNILLSEKTARAFFADQDPIGQMLKIGNSQEVKVTRVFARMAAGICLPDQHRMGSVCVVCNRGYAGHAAYGELADHTGGIGESGEKFEDGVGTQHLFFNHDHKFSKDSPETDQEAENVRLRKGGRFCVGYSRLPADRAFCTR
ncbi:MAG: hypothetical protein ABS46_20320 [Cytophagaceae bacterium SCN 52-12]|nr:MAG: hypothetical protein ABS46_20320 [Cytophagaceae bacterium SCN 52-12]